MHPEEIRNNNRLFLKITLFISLLNNKFILYFCISPKTFHLNIREYTLSESQNINNFSCDVQISRRHRHLFHSGRLFSIIMLLFIANSHLVCACRSSVLNSVQRLCMCCSLNCSEAVLGYCVCHLLMIFMHWISVAWWFG